MAEAQVAALGPTRVRELLVEANFAPGASMASLGDASEREELEAIDAECLTPDAAADAPT